MVVDCISFNSFAFFKSRSGLPSSSLLADNRLSGDEFFRVKETSADVAELADKDF